MKHWQVRASLSLVHLGHQTLEEDSAAVSGPGSTQGPGSSIPIWCLIYECPDTVHNSARGAVGQAAQEDITWFPDFMSFMFMAFFMPLPFSFLFFFFLQQHFLQMQKQQVRMRSPATTAMAMRAQGGTEGKSQCGGQPSLPPSQPAKNLVPQAVLEPVRWGGVIRRVTPGKRATHRGSC